MESSHVLTGISRVANSRPGTFYGGTLTFGQSLPEDGWYINYKQALKSQGIETYFVPAFSDSPVAPSDMYNTFPAANGLMSWDSAWPYVSEGKVRVSSAVDRQYMAAAEDSQKTFMMGSSSPFTAYTSQLI
jgi:hypothetical protein